MSGVEGASASEALLELVGLGCLRGDRMLFSGVEARVPAGHLLRVQGANGVGKTSLLRIVSGLAQPHEGEVRWQGLPLAAQREALHRELVYVGHGAALKASLSPVENLIFASRLAGRACDEAAALDAAAAAGLRHCEWLPVRMLSHGQRKRVALARLALAGRGGLWVLDEPFDGLDERAAQWLAGAIRLHLARGGIAVLTSHQPTALDVPGLPQVSLSL